MSAPECPVCRVDMELGYVLDAGQSGQLARAKWTEGRPQKSVFGGHKVKGKRRLETITYRCPRCGWLLWFAPDAREV